MAYTRDQFQSVLVRRAGKKLAYAGLDGTTTTGVNADLVDPIAQGLASVGIAPASLATITDADLAGLDPADAPQALDVAELRCLETVLGNRASPDQKALDSELLHGRFYRNLEQTCARKRLQVERQYGIGVAVLSAGVLDLGIAATLDPDTGRPD